MAGSRRVRNSASYRRTQLPEGNFGSSQHQDQRSHSRSHPHTSQANRRRSSSPQHRPPEPQREPEPEPPFSTFQLHLRSQCVLKTSFKAGLYAHI
ncbi:hypothetical protein K474DRAFT_1669563 [Panus rudis PR-1116 ss-1]|nr:hypothetical protein K474DRAFT_1669563 [Panus rudis PR-1116 ss-1]